MFRIVGFGRHRRYGNKPEALIKPKLYHLYKLLRGDSSTLRFLDLSREQARLQEVFGGPNMWQQKPRKSGHVVVVVGGGGGGGVPFSGSLN